eukprot:scaffold58689_cov36-Tisochrysis_lutea.AAC.1
MRSHDNDRGRPHGERSDVRAKEVCDCRLPAKQRHRPTSVVDVEGRHADCAADQRRGGGCWAHSRRGK